MKDILENYYKGIITPGEALDMLLQEIEGTFLYKAILATSGDDTFTDEDAIELIKETQCK